MEWQFSFSFSMSNQKIFPSNLEKFLPTFQFFFSNVMNILRVVKVEGNLYQIFVIYWL